MHTTSFISTFVVFFLAFLIQTSSAGVTFENPRGKSKWTGGKMNAIKWKESGNGTTLAALGTVTVSLHAGSNQKTTFLANLGTAPATDLKLIAKIPADIGPDGKTYYIHFAGSNGESFNSQKFAMEKMSGQFNTTILSTIQGSGSSSNASIPLLSTSISGTTGLTVGARPSSSSVAASSTVKSSASTRWSLSVLAAAPVAAVIAWSL